MKYILFLFLAILPSLALATYPNQVIQIQGAYPQNVVQRHTVEFDAQTYLGLNGYTGVVDKLKSQQLKQNQIDSATLADLISILKKVLENQKTTDISVPQPSQPTPTTSDSLDKQVYNIFKSKCANCHSDATASGGLKLITNNGGLYNLNANDRNEIYYRTAGGVLSELKLDLMPRGAPPLSDSEVKTLGIWALKKTREEKGK